MKAILLCAGLGQRCRPVTDVCPKALLPVQGKALLEHTLDLLHTHDVHDITLVVGHLAEHFRPLAVRHGAELRFNPDFSTRNNHSSLFVALDKLEDCLIIDGDLFFLHDWFSFLQPGVSQFISQPTRKGNEWRLELDADSRVTGVSKWQPDGYGMIGVSYWTGEAATMLAKEIEQCAQSEALRDEYWEDAALRVLTQTPVYATCLPDTFVQEIDTLADAMAFGLLNDQAIATLSSPGFAPVKLKGLTNDTWLIHDISGLARVLRIPGRGTERYIDREAEPAIVAQLHGRNVTPRTDFLSAGFKLTDYLAGHRVSAPHDMNPSYFAALAHLLQILHSIPYSKDSTILPLFIAPEIWRYEKLARISLPENQRVTLLQWAEEFDATPPVLSHRDLLLENILVSGDGGRDMRFIDFEYAGYTHPLWDAASFLLESGIQCAPREAFLQEAHITDAAALTRMEILVDYIWGLWGLVNGYDAYGQNRLERSRRTWDAHHKASTCGFL